MISDFFAPLPPLLPIQALINLHFWTRYQNVKKKRRLFIE